MEAQEKGVDFRSKRAASGGTDSEQSSSKSRKLSYKVCLHCNKELNMKIYKEHRKLYYDANKGIWNQDAILLDSDNEECSSEFSSLDNDMDYMNHSLENDAVIGGQCSEDFSDLDTEACPVVDFSADQNLQENTYQGIRVYIIST